MHRARAMQRPELQVLGCFDGDDMPFLVDALPLIIADESKPRLCGRAEQARDFIAFVLELYDEGQQYLTAGPEDGNEAVH